MTRITRKKKIFHKKTSQINFSFFEKGYVRKKEIPEKKLNFVIKKSFSRIIAFSRKKLRRRYKEIRGGRVKDRWESNGVYQEYTKKNEPKHGFYNNP